MNKRKIVATLELTEEDVDNINELIKEAKKEKIKCQETINYIKWLINI